MCSTGTMFCPESIDYLRAFPTVIFAIFRRQCNRINICSQIGPDINPFAFVTSGTGRCIEWLNLRFNLFFNLCKQSFHLLGIAASQLVFADKPRNRIQINTSHLHTQTGAFNQSRSATHKWFQDFQVGEFASFLMIAIIVIPYDFGCFRWVIRTFCGCSDQHGTEYT